MVRGRAPLACLLLLALFELGCEAYTGSTPGEAGVLGFYEPSNYPNDQLLSTIGFERPLAEGSRVDVWVTAPGVTSLESVTVDDESVVRIESSAYPIELRAVAPGTTTLRASTAQGHEDSLVLQVLPVDDVHLWVLEGGGLFGADTGGTGHAIRPGASVRIAAEPRSMGTALLGFDLLTWSVDDTVLSHRAGGSTVNTIHAEALGTAGVTTVSTDLGGALELATMAEADVPTLTLGSILSGTAGSEPLTMLTGEDTRLFALITRDAEGRHIHATTADADTFAASITGGDVVLLEADHGSGLVTLRACVGTGTLRLAYLGASLDVPIEITAEVADAECP